MVEQAIGFEEILKMLGWGKTKYFRKKQELIDLGIIFKRYEGRPPRTRTYAFPSRIHKYIALKARRGEKI